MFVIKRIIDDDYRNNCGDNAYVIDDIDINRINIYSYNTILCTDCIENALKTNLKRARRFLKMQNKYYPKTHFKYKIKYLA